MKMKDGRRMDEGWTKNGQRMDEEWTKDGRRMDEAGFRKYTPTPFPISAYTT